MTDKHPSKVIRHSPALLPLRFTLNMVAAPFVYKYHGLIYASSTAKSVKGISITRRPIFCVTPLHDLWRFVNGHQRLSITSDSLSAILPMGSPRLSAVPACLPLWLPLRGEPRLYGAGLSVTLLFLRLRAHLLLAPISANNPSPPHRPDKEGGEQDSHRYHAPLCKGGDTIYQRGRLHH